MPDKAFAPRILPADEVSPADEAGPPMGKDDLESIRKLRDGFDQIKKELARFAEGEVKLTPIQFRKGSVRLTITWCRGQRRRCR